MAEANSTTSAAVKRSWTRENIKALLVDLVVFLLLFSVFAYTYQSSVGDISALYFLLAVPFFLFSLLRFAITKSKALFLLPHLAVVLAPFLLPFDAVSREFLAAFLLVSAMFSIIAKFREPWSLQFKTAFIGVVINLLAFFLLNLWDNGGTVIFAFLNFSTLIILLAVVIYVHIESLDFNLLVSKHKQKRHAGSIINFNSKLILFFAAILTAGGAIVILTPATVVIESALFLVLRGFSWVLSTIVLNIVGFLGFLFPVINLNFAERREDELAGEIDEYNGFIIQEETVVNIPIYIPIIIALCFFIYRICRSRLNTGNISIRTFNSNFHSESNVKFAMGGIRRLFPRFRSLVKHPLRRAYIRKVRSHIKRGVPVKHYDTPDEIAKKIGRHENIDDLTAMYEKVRYGDFV
ncbi:MAG: DUF4129 domain-containing protein [Defluviitaleaceae bacterium]|nr:DUF4129 domain-containing protein [Defluviitaleaceae bacterium]